MPNKASGWAARAPSLESRIRGRALQVIRREHLLHEPACRHCAAEGKQVRGAEVDHIKPLFRGGTETPENRQTLCLEHHKAKSATERGFVRKVKQIIGLDGWPVT